MESTKPGSLKGAFDAKLSQHRVEQENPASNDVLTWTPVLLADLNLLWSCAQSNLWPGSIT